MKRSLLSATILALLLVGTPVLAQQDLTIGSGSSVGLNNGSVDVTLTSTAPTEGFVLAIGYDTTKLSAISANTAGPAAGAELIAPEIFDALGGLTLGVVMDAAAPFDGQTIAPSAGAVVATIEFMPDINLVDPDPAQTIPLTFEDGTLNSPPLNNIIVQGGLSLGDGDITLNDGSYTCLPAPPADLKIVGGSINAQNGPNPGCAQVTLTNSGAVQGFVLAIEHDSDLTLASISVAGAAAAASPEFVVPNIDNANNGGTLGVVLDFVAPFDGQTIAPGTDQVIAEFCYTCDNPPSQPDPATTHALNFVDGTLGSPTLDNVIVVAGLSVNPNLFGGEMTCEALVPSDTMFFCGQQDDEGNLVDPCGNIGDTVELCFFYKDPTDNIAGFQLAVVFDCCLEFIEGTFSVEGTILDEVGAEFVNHNVDNDPHDGDGCEFVAGILLDALPPFDRQTVPPTADPLKIGGIDVLITDACECNESYEVSFQDGVNGRGNVPIENVVVINTTESEQGFITMPCNICVEAEDEFIRGDCNFDDKVNIADSSTILAAQFQGFVVNCEDACDANDDGKINLADSVYILNYQFKFGAEPPAPFPDQGTDDTTDDPSGLHGELGCENGRNPCPNP